MIESNIHFNTYPTPIEYFGKYYNNNIYIKRDDLTEPTMGGNKVRKLELFLADAKNKQADIIVTYGAPQSNHCRLTVSMANRLGFKSLLILSKSDQINFNGNFLIYSLFNTEIVWTDIDKVPESIDETLQQLTASGHKPYFIQGGGHGDLGTHAYKLTYDEILSQEEQLKTTFKYIFHASGTGTTQAGLIAGNLLNQKEKVIIGISIARKERRGKKVITESVQSYLDKIDATIGLPYGSINLVDKYIGKGYADIYPEITETVKRVVQKSSLLLDPVYTGKAFYGMIDYVKELRLNNENILFIHTGGIPLLFNYASKFKEE